MLSIEQLKSRVGAEWELGTCEVERGAIQRFVSAIYDPNPLWQGAEIAPPAFALTLVFERVLQELLSATSGALLHGSTELECHSIICAGDLIKATAKITGIRERQSERGKMAFITLDITLSNQNKELVARCRQMVIQY